MKLELVENLRRQLHVSRVGSGQPEQPDCLSDGRSLILRIGPPELQQVSQRAAEQFRPRRIVRHGGLPGINSAFKISGAHRAQRTALQ